MTISILPKISFLRLSLDGPVGLWAEGTAWGRGEADAPCCPRPPLAAVHKSTGAERQLSENLTVYNGTYR